MHGTALRLSFIYCVTAAVSSLSWQIAWQIIHPCLFTQCCGDLVQVPNLIGQALPASSKFFFTYLIMRTFLAVPLRFLITQPGVWQSWLRLVGAPCSAAAAVAAAVLPMTHERMWFVGAASLQGAAVSAAHPMVLNTLYPALVPCPSFS